MMRTNITSGYRAGCQAAGRTGLGNPEEEKVNF